MKEFDDQYKAFGVYDKDQLLKTYESYAEAEEYVKSLNQKNELDNTLDKNNSSAGLVNYYNVTIKNNKGEYGDPEFSHTHQKLHLKMEAEGINLNTGEKELLKAGQYGIQSVVTDVYDYWDKAGNLIKQFVYHKGALNIPKSRTIFVNGYLGFGSPKGGKDYWNESFEKGSREFFGGEFLEPHYTNIDYAMNTTSYDRQVAGYTYARNNLKELTKGMNQKSDAFYLVSHSMGAAFAFGIEIYLLSIGWTVKSSIFLNAFQAANLNIEHNKTGKILHLEYRNDNDPVIDNDVQITGEIDLRVNHKANTDMQYVHRYPIDKGAQFWEDLEYEREGRFTYYESFKKLMK